MIRRGRHAHVGLDQPRFQVVEERLVDLAAEPARMLNKLGRLRQPLLEPFQKAFDRHVRLS